MVDQFSLSTTGGRIRIGMVRFSTTSEATVGMTDIDIHAEYGIDPGRYHLRDSGGSPNTWTTVKGSDLEMGSHTPAQGSDPSADAEWEEAPDYWETAPASADEVMPAATWTQRQRLWTEDSDNQWRWKVQRVRDAQISDLFTSAADTAPTS